MNNCPFCEIQGKVLAENDLAALILSNPRKVPGHALVVPKRHTEEPWDITPEERLAIFELVDQVSQKLLAAGLGDGVDVRQNYRPFLTQGKLKVNHIHYHVIPRALEDYIYQVSERYDTELFAELDPAEAKEITRFLK